MASLLGVTTLIKESVASAKSYKFVEFSFFVPPYYMAMGVYQSQSIYTSKNLKKSSGGKKSGYS